MTKRLFLTAILLLSASVVLPPPASAQQWDFHKTLTEHFKKIHRLQQEAIRHAREIEEHFRQQAQQAAEQARKAAQEAQRASQEAARKAAEEARRQAELREKAAKEAAEKARKEEEERLRKLAQARADKENVVIVTQRKSWWDAEAHCRKTYGTSLVSIKDKTANDAIKRLMLDPENKVNTQPVWIGLNRFGTRYWHWSDATDAQFTHWGYYARWRWYQFRNCAAQRRVRFHNGKVDTRSYADHCASKRAFICWKPGKKPSVYSVADHVAPNLRKSAPDCAVSYNKFVTYSEALKECRAGKDCAGVTMHAYFAKRPKLKTRANFLKNGPQCKRLRYYSPHYSNYVTYIKDGVDID